MTARHMKAVAVGVVVIGGSMWSASVPVSAAPVLPPGTSAWVTGSDFDGVPWDGFYLRRTGNQLKMAFVNGLEGSCGRGTLAGDSARIRNYGYATPTYSTMTFSRTGTRLKVTRVLPERTFVTRYRSKTLPKAAQLFSKGRSADMTARALLRGC